MMSPSEKDDQEKEDAQDGVGIALQDQSDETTKQKLELELNIGNPSACQRHITVTISREDIDRYYNEAFSDMMDKSNVPGFRVGRAPRKLVEARFRKEVTEQIKGSLLMDSLSQITEDETFSAISEPDLDYATVEVPEEGPMTFEFDIEVRPEFDLPDWKGLTIDRPTRKFTKKDIDAQMKHLLARYGKMVPCDEAAEPDDYLVVNLTFKHDGKVIHRRREEDTICIRPTLSFRDGKIEKFDKLMKDVLGGETREGTVELTQDAPNQELRGQQVTVVFEVLEVKKLELPEMTPDFLDTIGSFESEGDFRDAIMDSLERQLDYHRQQEARKQITAALTESADWELPPELLKRQSQRELERSVLELRRSGFNEAAIRAHENELRQNSQEATGRALKEHFILERIAEEEKVEDLPDDYDEEIDLIAAQTGESVRRVRARLEKEGLMDSLRNQILERKVIKQVLDHAEFKEVKYKLPQKMEVEAIDIAAGGQQAGEDIPEVETSGEATPETWKESHTGPPE